MDSPEQFFHSLRYLRSNARRLEHLAMLNLPFASRSVLEIGAGIGDLTPFFLDRGCVVTSVDPRACNVATLRRRFGSDPLWPSERLRVVQSDVTGLREHHLGEHDVVFAYSVFNEFDDPVAALETLAGLTGDMLVMEVAADAGPHFREERIEFRDRDSSDPTASIAGRGCLPTRPWMFNRLRAHFSHVYMPLTQPAFERYRRDWREPGAPGEKYRAIFVASREPIVNPGLVEAIPDLHRQ